MYRFRRPLVPLLLVLALLASACGGGDDGDASDGGSGDDAGTAAGDDGGADDTTTTSTTTTEAAPEGAVEIPDLQLSVIEFGDAGFVQITNVGANDVDLSGIFLCQFPTYIDLGTVVDGGVIAASSSVQIEAGAVGGLDSAGGEAALYTTNDFTNPDAIFGYVQWGSGGARAEVAAEAGIWPPGASVTPDPAFSNIELFGDPANPESWS